MRRRIKMISDKRGQVFETAAKSIYWTIAGIAITAVIMAFALTVAGYKNKLVQVPEELETGLTALRFANVKECFALEDENSGKVMAGIIDLKKFNEDQLDGCYPIAVSVGRGGYAFRLLLLSENKEIKTKEYYAGLDKFSFNKEVLVSKNGNLLKDQLIIYTQNLKIKSG